MIIKKRYLFLAGLAFFWSSIAHAQTAKPGPQTIIQAMAARYRTASSYQDSGSVRVVPAEPKIANRLEGFLLRRASFDDDVLVSFKTYFDRPRMFRFDWTNTFSTGSRESSIWSDGKKIYEWMPSDARDDGFTLSSSNYLTWTIDKAQRSSAGAVFPLNSMLIKEASVVSFGDLLSMATELALIKDEPFERNMCFVVKANISGAPWTLWIDKQNYLLRKTRTVYSYGSFDERVEKGVRHEFLAEEIHREIRINEPISKTVFKYRPQFQAHDIDLTR